MAHNNSNNRLVDLLVILKSHHSLADYNLSLYCQQEETAARQVTTVQSCGAIIQNPSGSKMVIPFLEKQIKTIIGHEKHFVCRLHGGLLSFLVPFRSSRTLFCLVGEGVREESVNILELKELSGIEKSDVFDILERLEKLPVKTFREVDEVAVQTRQMVLQVLEETNYRVVMDKTKMQLNGITRSLSQMDDLNTVEEIISLSGELLKTLFNVPKIAVATRDERNEDFQVKGIWGLPEELGRLSEDKLQAIVSPDAANKFNRFDDGFRELFPDVEAVRVGWFPLETQEILLGFIALFDGDLQSMDDHLVKLITNRVTARLRQLKKERERMQVESLSNNLMSLTNSLVFVESKEELYKNVLEIAADLVRASCGSLMLIDKSGRSLHIGFCMGMNLQLARSISIRMGEGIAGKVASSGQPLLVDNIEKDSRIGMRNRPRFKTKSLVSVPLKLKERTIGVLNLSDKDDLGIFNEIDMNLLASFANLASLMIERAWTLERSFKLEQLSVTDHLTGLYNRRFLRNRLEEELNRSSRHGLPLTLIFIDLDFFKIYNDLCGHLAGDSALQKAADIIRGGVRDMDIVARYGGEEFCVILPDTAKSEAVLVAERIRQEIEKERFPKEENLPCGRLTASFGVASFPHDGQTFTTLIHSADMALYKAKADGRNRIILGQPSLPNVRE
jgi:diguanylate cyclase (GGDEF)-like protein